MSRGPYRIEQVAQILGLHPDTVRDHCDARLLECYRTAGGHRRITALAVDEYVRRMTARHAA